MKKSTQKALVVGSVAFDIIFSVEGDMKDELPLHNGQIHNINITLIANQRNQYYGGTAANIAYGIGLLKDSPLMFSVVGKDFYPEFEDRLKRTNVIPKVISGKDGTFTSHAYQISDKNHHQIVIWQPNVYYDLIDQANLSDTITPAEFANTKVAIFSPGTPISTLNHLLEFNKAKEKDAISIFDPGQILNLFTKEQMLQSINLSNIVIANDIEIASLKNTFDLGVGDILKIGPDYVIETKGAEGSIIHSKKGQIKVPIAKPRAVIETTGAGDAYRSGLIHGLLGGNAVEKAAKFGAVMASFCVEYFSGQTYSFTAEEFGKRLEAIE